MTELLKDEITEKEIFKTLEPKWQRNVIISAVFLFFTLVYDIVSICAKIPFLLSLIPFVCFLIFGFTGLTIFKLHNKLLVHDFTVSEKAVDLKYASTTGFKYLIFDGHERVRVSEEIFNNTDAGDIFYIFDIDEQTAVFLANKYELCSEYSSLCN